MKRKLIILQLLSFASFASMNYYTILLQETGFSASQIGFFSAAGGVLAMVTLPIWGIISDRTGSLRFTYFLSMALYAVIFLLFPVFAKSWAAGVVVPIYLTIFLYYLVKQPTHSLQDAWFISVCEPRGIRYGELRMFGSLGFGIVAILTGFLAKSAGTGTVFCLPVLFMIPLFMVAGRVGSEDGTEDEAEQTMPGKKTGCVPDASGERSGTAGKKPGLSALFKNYYYVTALFAVFGLALYGAVTGAFYGFILEHAGVDPSRYGLFSGYGAVLQCVVIFGLNKLEGRIPRPFLLILGGVIAVFENLLYSVAQGMPMMFLAATLWGVEMSVNVAILPKYVYTLVPKEFQATAQTISGTCAMALGILGNFLGGRLIDRIGIAGLNRTVALTVFVFTLLFAGSLFFGKYVLKIEPETGQN